PAPGPVANPGAAPRPAAAPAQPAPLVIRGADLPVSGGYSVEGESGIHIETRILTIPTSQASIVYLSAPIRAPIDFSDVAPHWDSARPVDPTAPPDTSTVLVELRTSPDGQTWTAWQSTDLEDITDPRDPITRTYASLVGVPQTVRTHRYAQARITLSAVPGTPPPQITNLTLSFIDGGVTTQALVATIEGGPVPAKPAVISRTAWGSPDGNSSPNWPPEYRRVTHVIVHHTETDNSDGDYAARVRSIWYYHAITHGWGDIGYNYLIDPHGNVYEGRAGGDDVAAGHAYPFNYGSLGVSLIGNYDAIAPSSAMRDSLIKLLAWVTDRRGIDPQGTGSFTGALNCGGSVTLLRPNIAGHRDFRGVGCGHEFNAKTCPGAYAYALLPTIRAALGVGLPPYRAVFESHVTPLTMAPGALVTATVIVRNGGSLTWPRGGPNPVHLGYHWYTLAGDPLTGGYQDVRTNLPQDVPYGAAVTLVAPVGAPSTPGVYELRWDLVHELKTWFADAGSTPLSVRVAVAATDTTPPVAQVQPLPPYQGDSAFAVAWSGSDSPGGGGIAAYDVQYRISPSSPWVDWQTGTTLTTATFAGADGYTYFFRARARDKAGNQGAYPDVPDTLTTVVAHPPTLLIRSPQNGQRVPPGPLTVAGQADSGDLVQVNGTPAAVAPDGTFSGTVTVPPGPLPITVEVQGV
ncbi:MAG TPA: N-acetylmuramoyl-L-alanine amidase, partial [Chloroflexia bacterium]|nr:N-acetylmuramoyl-L-alanine amidase [Chloroflexia bacterium]